MIDINDIIVIEDFIPSNYQELIKDTILHTYDHEWYLKKSLSESTTESTKETWVDAPGFVNVFFNRLGITNPQVYHLVMPMLLKACDQINFKVEEILFGRTFLQMPMTTHQGMTNPHVDTDLEHLVCIYYPIDSDGETVFFNTFDDPPGSERPDFNNAEVYKKILPKQGQAVLFNGRRYHTNILPQKNMRVVMNFKVVGKCQ